MASFVNIHRRLGRTHTTAGLLSQDYNRQLWGIMLSGISVISVAKPHLSPSLPAVQYLSVAKAGAAGLLKAGARL